MGRTDGRSASPTDGGGGDVRASEARAGAARPVRPAASSGHRLRVGGLAAATAADSAGRSCPSRPAQRRRRRLSSVSDDGDARLSLSLSLSPGLGRGIHQTRRSDPATRQSAECQRRRVRPVLSPSSRRRQIFDLTSRSSSPPATDHRPCTVTRVTRRRCTVTPV